LRACNFAGANVTIPHKSAVLPYCDHLSELSALIGAVNTLYFDKKNLCGTTTDAEGFFRSLRRIGATIDGANMVIVGNGGTARTLVYAAALRNTTRSLALVGRNRERVEALAAEVQSRTGREIRGGSIVAGEGRKVLKSCDLLVNCTSAGMHPHTDISPIPPELIHGGMVVVDAIYNPSRTVLMSYAEQANCTTANGLSMLLYQGLESFRYWTGREVDDTMFDLDELQGMVNK
ncbi:MAG: shikimate dehydrogenase, partial [Chitinivibrionales bacterium]|nr:shikimate dehydrogenase [Chitinivibrionales bacterium]MBD3357673.1 shikimate dehydrogenase [Chitinivibrionales bacterium]